MIIFINPRKKEKRVCYFIHLSCNIGREIITQLAQKEADEEEKKKKKEERKEKTENKRKEAERKRKEAERKRK